MLETFKLMPAEGFILLALNSLLAKAFMSVYFRFFELKALVTPGEGTKTVLDNRNDKYYKFVSATQLNESEWFGFMGPLLIFMHINSIVSGPAVVFMTVGNIAYFWGSAVMNHLIPRAMGATLRYVGVSMAMYYLWTAKWK